MSESKMIDRAHANVRDVADHFGVSERTVRRWLQATDIPYRRIAGTIRFNIDEVDVWASRRGRPKESEEESDR